MRLVHLEISQSFLQFLNIQNFLFRSFFFIKKRIHRHNLCLIGQMSGTRGELLNQHKGTVHSFG